MTDENDPDQRFSLRIRQELDRLPLTENQRAAAIPGIMRYAHFLDTHNGNSSSGHLQCDSSFFDFSSKLQEVVTRFGKDGLTLPQYLQAALKQPSLFIRSSGTIVGNIEGVVDSFADKGLTTTQYLQAVLKQPSLFTQSPGTIADNIEGVTDHFAAEGLTTKEYLRAALKQPPLFAQSPATIAGNIEGVADHFAAEGLTTKQYLRAALKQPSLFARSPATIAGNIEGVANHFATEGLTTKQYLQAALKQPPLFVQSPATIAGHISIVFDLADRGIFQPPELRQESPIHAAVLDFLLTNPLLLTLADDNFRLREIHQRLTNGPSGSRLLKTPRHFVERQLARHLGHDDLARPVPSEGFVAGMESPTEQARRFLLRALMHAGYIKGGNLER